MAIDSPPASGSNVDLLRWSFDRLNHRDLSALRQLWTAETVERFPDRTCVGPDEIAAYFEEALAALPDWHMEVKAIAAEGEDAFVHWRLTGTHLGPVLGVQPTGRPLAVDGMDHFVLRDGKVVSNFVVFDRMQWAQQIGMLPPDGSAADRGAKSLFNLRTRAVRRLRRA